MDKISVEIATHITSLISLQRDVVPLCLVSSQWLEMARPILYRHLRLAYGSKSLPETLRMLNKNERVRNSVIALYLDGRLKEPDDDMDADWIYDEDFDGMHNIRSLTVSGFFYFSSSNIQHMFAKIYSAAPNLMKLRFEDRIEEEDTLEPLDIIPCALTDVFTYYEGPGTDLMKTTFLLNPGSIIKLNLFEDLDYSHRGLYELLPSLRFPSLCIFKIGIFIDTDPDETCKPLLDFLAAHPSIVSCSISSNKGLNIDISTAPRNILPNLTSLSTNYCVLEDLSKICGVFRNLASLEINNKLLESWGQEQTTIRLLSVLEDITLRTGGFPELRHFKAWEPSIGSVTPLLNHMALVAPSINQLTFLEPEYFAHHRASHESLLLNFIVAINEFPKLKRLDLNGTNLSVSKLSSIIGNSKTIEFIYLYEGGDELNEASIVERIGNPSLSSSFRILDRVSSDIWWMRE